MGVGKPNAGAEADRSHLWLEVDSGVLEGTGRNRIKGCLGAWEEKPGWGWPWEHGRQSIQ